MIVDWIIDNYIEIFGALTGILYVFLEIRQTIWLWPVGITTSAVYIWVFLTGKLYADMSLQVYYLVVSVLGWYWWTRRVKGRMGEGETGGKGDDKSAAETKLVISQLTLRTGVALLAVLVLLYAGLYAVLSRFTDSPVPAADSFITSLSIIGTWLLARKIFEHWYVWIVVNTAASLLFFSRGLYPTVMLYIIYGVMSFAGLRAWRKTLLKEAPVR